MGFWSSSLPTLSWRRAWSFGGYVPLHVLLRDGAPNMTESLGKVVGQSHDTGCGYCPHLSVNILAFSSQAQDLAKKVEVLKPLFVEPRNKGSFSEVCDKLGIGLCLPLPPLKASG